MVEIAERLNIEVVYETISWDAMIAAVSEGQFDMGMTGITIREDRAEMVDFSDSYMVSQMRMLVRADEERFADAAGFAADADYLLGTQAGTTPFYVGVYEVLDGDEANPRIVFFETFGAAVQGLLAGDVDLVLTDSTGGEGYVRANPRCVEADRRSAGHRRVRVHLPARVGPRRPVQRRDCGDARGWHAGRAEPALVRGLRLRAVTAGVSHRKCRSGGRRWSPYSCGTSTA